MQTITQPAPLKFSDKYTGTIQGDVELGYQLATFLGETHGRSFFEFMRVVQTRYGTFRPNQVAKLYHELER